MRLGVGTLVGGRMLPINHSTMNHISRLFSAMLVLTLASVASVPLAAQAIEGSGLANLMTTQPQAVTASGESYNPLAMTAAHPSMPFGTLVRVINPRSGQSAIVRITDRDVAAGHTLAISQAAANRVGVSDRGVHIEWRLAADELGVRTWTRGARNAAPAVEAEPIPVAPPAAPDIAPETADEPANSQAETYTVQVAAYRERASAEDFARMLRGGWVLQAADSDGAPLYRVLYGRFNSAESAAQGRELLGDRGVEGFVRVVRPSVGDALVAIATP
ncbi:hypothetical protein BH23BAC4_BH23BAC4_01530 [soil metagenome]